MFLARVEGSVVATKKDPSMSGRKLLLLRPQLVDEKEPTKFRPGANTIIAVDSVGAGIGELVSAFTSVKNAGGELKLLNLTRKVHDLLQITKLYTVFDVKDDEASAISSFK